MSVIDKAVYVDGRRREAPRSRDCTRAVPQDGEGFAWIGLLRPDDAEMSRVAQEYGLPALAVEDAVTAHQRPKIECYRDEGGDVEFVVLRPARYVDEDEDVQVGEVHLFLGSDFVVVVRHAEVPDLTAVRRRLEADPALLALGPRAVLYAILDHVVDGYRPVVEGLRCDIDQIETEVFGGDPAVSRRIYQLSREVIEFQRACDPLRPMLDTLLADTAPGSSGSPGSPGDGVALHRGLRDVADHVAQVRESADGFRQLLERLLTVNASLIGQRQNEEMRRLSETSLAQGEQAKTISAWAAIIFAPSLIGGVYGMNFDGMPELHWSLGYPFALTLMVLVALVLFLLFRRRGWL